MATMKFFNALDVPSEGAVDGTYYVKDGDRVNTYIVSGGKVIPSDVDLSGYAHITNLELKANHGYTSNPKTLKEVDDSLAQLAGDVNLFKEKAITIDDIDVIGAKMDGVSSHINCSPITIANDGDYVEFDVLNETNVSSQGYGFAGRTDIYTTSIGISTNGVTVRDSANNWIILSPNVKALPYPRIKIKIARENDKINVYYDGIIAETGNYQEPIVINGFGNRYSGNGVYWKGWLISVEINGEKYKITELPGVEFVSGVKVVGINGFLTETQKKQIDKSTEDIEYLSTALINANIEGIKDVVYATIYSSYNRNSSNPSVTNLTKGYLIKEVGDYIELKARYWGDSNGSRDKLSMVGPFDVYARFGLYNLSEFWFRAIGTNQYDKWTLSNINVNEWHTYKLIVVSTGVELFVDGVSFGIGTNNLNSVGYIVTKICPPDAGLPQKYDVKYVLINSARDGVLDIDNLSSYQGSTNVELKDDREEVDISVNPLCFVSYNSVTKIFNIYARDEENQDTYYGFKIVLQTSRGTPNDPIYYSHAWRLYDGQIYTYNKSTNAMSPTGITTVHAGESECVFMHTDPNGGKVDHTGGVHGDETIDVTVGDFAKFYVDGVPLTELELLESFTMRACSEFKYIQKSSIHETAYYENNVDTELAATGAGDLTLKADTGTFAIDGVDTGIPAYNQNSVFSSTASIINDGITLSVSDTNTWVLSRIRRVYNNHPVIATHLKKSIMKGQKFHTENTLIFNNTRELKYWYAGIYCLGKGVAIIGHNEDYEDVEFTGSGGMLLSKSNDDYRLFEAYNPTTGCSAIVKSWITDEGGVLDDNNCTMLVWDRVSDSKYYRSFKSFAPIIGERMTAVTEVEYNKRSD